MSTHDDFLDRQLDAIRRVHIAFADAGIDYWLFGGWAVDFHVGSVTRPHDDVDMFVWLDDLPEISRLLETAGWHHAPSEEDDGGTGFEAGSVRLELTFLGRDDGDGIFTEFGHGRAIWSATQFGNDFRDLLDVRARVVSRESLTESKAWPREDPADAAKDRADFDALSRFVH